MAVKNAKAKKCAGQECSENTKMYMSAVRLSDPSKKRASAWMHRPAYCFTSIAGY